MKNNIPTDMIAAKMYIYNHMEKYCGPIVCLPSEVRDSFGGFTSMETGKTHRFYFALFCARNRVPLDLCLAYMKVFGLNRRAANYSATRRIYQETLEGKHVEYYAYICSLNSCVDPVSGEVIGARFPVGKMSSFRLYELQKENSIQHNHSSETSQQFKF